MNAAFAEFWAQRFSDSLFLPYKAAGFLKSGQKLFSSLDELPDDPSADRELIDSWMGRLNLGGWYRWVPYQSPHSS